MPEASIYSIRQPDTRDKLDVARAAQVTLDGHYTSLAVSEIAGKLFLLGYDKSSKKTDTYVLTADDPWVDPEIQGHVR